VFDVKVNNVFGKTMANSEKHYRFHVEH